MSTVKLRNFLPKHYSKIIRERLLEKTGKDYNRSYICMVITGKRTSSVILQEAALLASEERDRRLRTAEILESIVQ